MENTKKLYSELNYILEIYDEIVDIYISTNKYEKYINYNKDDIDMIWIYFYYMTSYNNVNDEKIYHLIQNYSGYINDIKKLVTDDYISSILKLNLNYEKNKEINISYWKDTKHFKSNKQYMIVIFNLLKDHIKKISQYL
jgi:hypothetical protein